MWLHVPILLFGLRARARRTTQRNPNVNDTDGGGECGISMKWSQLCTPKKHLIIAHTHLHTFAEAIQKKKKMTEQSKCSITHIFVFDMANSVGFDCEQENAIPIYFHFSVRFYSSDFPYFQRNNNNHSIMRQWRAIACLFSFDTIKIVSDFQSDTFVDDLIRWPVNRNTKNFRKWDH